MAEVRGPILPLMRAPWRDGLRGAFFSVVDSALILFKHLLLALPVPRGSRRVLSRQVLEKVRAGHVLSGRAPQPCPGLPVRLLRVLQSRSLLLLVVYDGVVHLLAFDFRPFLRGGACLAIL